VTRGFLERELQELRDEVLLLGSMVEKAIQRSVEALRTRDLALSQQVVDEDALINAKRFQIEERCLQVIATQQPTASDLRTIIAILFIITDLERMADHAEGIGRISLMIGEEPLTYPLTNLQRMADKAIKMLQRSITAFMERDVREARQVCDVDDEVDALYDVIYVDAISQMIREQTLITPLTHLLWAAHNLERIADRATNICERVVFLVTGRMEEVPKNVSRY